jgi:hypothetical protein
MRTESVLVGREDDDMIDRIATEVFVQDRHEALQSAARHRPARQVPHHPVVRVWLGWMLVRAGWRIAASGRRTNMTICGRTTL